MARRALAGLALAVLALLLAGAGPHGSAPAAAAAEELHHAAIVVDTGDGQVRKMCLAFSEAEIDGIEALRRVDTRPYRFETFGSKGAGVCMLCGVGCPSGDCFCDPSKYWAYFRAGPGGEPYQASRVGASSTSVRDGDVEGWRWGTGQAPPATTVSETCGVDEPPKRATAAATTTTAAEPAPTTTPGSGDEPTSTTSSSVLAGSAGATTAPTAPGRTAATGGGVAASSTTSTSTSTAPDAGDAGPADATADDGADSSPADRRTRSDTTALDGSASGGTVHGSRDGGSGAGSVAGAVGFAVVLAGLAVWRVRLRRANAARTRAAAG